MPTNSRKTGFPEFFADTQSAESVRKQFLETPLKAAWQSALGPATELGQLLSLLPSAFAASQRRELKRIKDSAEENDARVAALESSIEEADALLTMAHRGELRVKRSLVALASDRYVFHGFVSDSDLNPLEGLTVRITSSKARSPLSAKSDPDGYFSIPLGKRTYTKSKMEGVDVSIPPDLFGEFFARQGDARAAQEPPDDAREESRVEIMKKQHVLHEDPVPVILNKGSVYREYVINDKSSASDVWEFMPDLESRVAATVDAAAPASASARRRSSKPAAASRGAKKTSSRSAKSTKKKNK